MIRGTKTSQGYVDRLLSVLVIYRGWLDSFTAVKLVGTIRQRLVIFTRILSSKV